MSRLAVTTIARHMDGSGAVRLATDRDERHHLDPSPYLTDQMAQTRGNKSRLKVTNLIVSISHSQSPPFHAN